MNGHAVFLCSLIVQFDELNKVFELFTKSSQNY